MSIIRKDSPKIKQLHKPKLYVITVLIDTGVDEDILTEYVNDFCHSIPSNDWSMNIMYADRERIALNRKLNKI